MTKTIYKLEMVNLSKQVCFGSSNSNMTITSFRSILTFLKKRPVYMSKIIGNREIAIINFEEIISV